MPSIDEIFSFEKNFEAGVTTRFASIGISPVYPILELTEELPEAYIAFEASNFERASKQVAIAPNGTTVFAHYSGQLTYEVTTPRTADGVKKHREWVAKIRALHARPNPSMFSPLYSIISCASKSGAASFIKDGERDRSELTFQIEFCLLPGAIN